MFEACSSLLITFDATPLEYVNRMMIGMNKNENQTIHFGKQTEPWHPSSFVQTHALCSAPLLDPPSMISLTKPYRS